MARNKKQYAVIILRFENKSIHLGKVSSGCGKRRGGRLWEEQHGTDSPRETQGAEWHSLRGQEHALQLCSALSGEAPGHSTSPFTQRDPNPGCSACPTRAVQYGMGEAMKEEVKGDLLQPIYHQLRSRKWGDGKRREGKPSPSCPYH